MVPADFDTVASCSGMNGGHCRARNDVQATESVADHWHSDGWETGKQGL